MDFLQTSSKLYKSKSIAISITIYPISATNKADILTTSMRISLGREVLKNTEKMQAVQHKNTISKELKSSRNTSEPQMAIPATKKT